MRLVVLALLAGALAAQQAPAPSMPAWLANYPGVTPKVQEGGGNVEVTYTTSAAPALVVQHYGKLFDTAGLPFQPNPDGIGTAIRGSAQECDLLILIRQQGSGTAVEVNCASKAVTTAPSSSASSVQVINGGGPAARGRRGTPAAPVSQAPHLSAAEMQARHEELVKEMHIHPEYRDAPAPPMVWPSWLVHANGGRLQVQQAVDQSKRACLKAQYVTSQPMSEIYQFYRDVLQANEYQVHNSELSTGHTTKGVQQNAYGYVEATNYPNGAPGARTVIRVDFSRSYLNEPITVRLRFTPYEFVAPKR